MHPQPKSIVEVEKLFDEKFAIEGMNHENEKAHMVVKFEPTWNELKQFWLEHYRSLIEGLKRPLIGKCNCDDECSCFAIDNEREEINTAIQTLLEVK